MKEEQEQEQEEQVVGKASSLGLQVLLPSPWQLFLHVQLQQRESVQDGE